MAFAHPNTRSPILVATGWEVNKVSTVWKIAPGEGAEDWPVSREQDYIALGWMCFRDFAKFHSQEDVLEALIKEHPRGDEEGNREGAARSIWYFVNRVQQGHVVVANNGRGGVAGIGIITSDYLTPRSPKNPIRNDERVWRRHARRVEWVIDQPIDLRQTYFFGINTVTRLAPKRVAYIRRVYLKWYPQLRQKLERLFGPP